jgi:hypothetical protein
MHGKTGIGSNKKWPGFPKFVHEIDMMKSIK